MFGYWNNGKRKSKNWTIVTCIENVCEKYYSISFCQENGSFSLLDEVEIEKVFLGIVKV